jgi:hypothetical protein
MSLRSSGLQVDDAVIAAASDQEAADAVTTIVSPSGASTTFNPQFCARSRV